MVHFGRTTVIKFVGGEMLVREMGTDLVALRHRYEGMKRRALDLRPVWQAFKPTWLRATIQVFAAQGLPAPWPPLSKRYGAWKAIHYPGKKMMRRQDWLYESLTQDGSPGMIWQGTARTLHYGTRVPYWKYGQAKRPTVILLRSTFSRLNKLVLEHVARGTV